MSERSAKFECRHDGLVIRGKVYGDTALPKPIVILSHGFLANQKMCGKYARLLANIGYVAVTFDFCGGGLGCKSDGKSENMTILSEVRDLLSIIDHVKKQPYAKSVSLLGCSQGGFVSAMAARKLPDQIEKLILMYPALCIPDDARKGKMMFYRFENGKKSYSPTSPYDTKICNYQCGDCRRIQKILGTDYAPSE